MPTIDMKLMMQINQLFEPPSSLFRGDQSRETRTTRPDLRPSEADTPERQMNDSPCSSSSGTLFSEEDDLHLHTHTHKPADDQQSLAPGSCKSWQEIASHPRISAPQPRKSEFNPNAAPFVPSPSTILHQELSASPAPTLVDATQTRQELLLAGISASEPSRRRELARALVASDCWRFDALCDLVRHFCWTSAHAGHTVSCPGPAALFARDVHDAVASAATEWESSCFAFQLRSHARAHFTAQWSSIDNSSAISACRQLDGEQCRLAFNLSCFIADMFVLRLVDALTVHECLGILLREMAGVEHVFAIQAMVMRAGAGLWKGADSYRLLRRFTRSFVERSSWLQDDASLSGLETSIREVIKDGNIICTINEWHAQHYDHPLPTGTSIWA